MAGSFPNIESALSGPVLDLIRAQWVMLAQPHSATGHYVRGLFDADSAQYPYQGNRLSVALRNLVDYAAVIEFGHSGFHLPDRIKTWKHISKKTGKGYIIIPFRQFTPGNQSASMRAGKGMMPQEIYDRAKNLGAGQRITGLGDQYKQSKSYIYYRAKEPNFPAGLARYAQRTEGHPGYTWKASQFEGMKRSAQVTPKANQGTYNTFRVLTQDSAGWWIPAMQGQFYTRKVADLVGPEISRVIGRAAALDTAEHIAVTMSGAGFTTRIKT